MFLYVCAKTNVDQQLLAFFTFNIKFTPEKLQSLQRFLITMHQKEMFMLVIFLKKKIFAMADPGFPRGGAPTPGGGAPTYY